MASQRAPGFGAPQRPGAPPTGGLGFPAPPQGYGPQNQGIAQAASRPDQGFTPQGCYPMVHLPGGTSAPRLPAAPSCGFAQYPPPGGASVTRLPYGARSDVTIPRDTPFGLTMPDAGSAFQPSSGSSLQGTYDPQPPALGLGSRQTHIAAYEQEWRSPQEGGRPQAPLSTNASSLPGPYQTIVGASPSGGIQPGSNRSSPIPAWQNPNPGGTQTNSGRSSPLSMGRNSSQGLGMPMPMRPTASEERAPDGSFRYMDPFRDRCQPAYPQLERTMSSFSSADAGAGSRPVGLAGTQSTSPYSERSGHPLRPPAYPPGQNQEHQKPHRPYAPPLAFSSEQMSSPDQNNAKYRSGPRSFPDPLSTGTSSGLGSKTASAGSFVGFKADQPSPTRSSRLISEEKLIASFVNAEAQKSLKNVHSKSRTPGRKAEGEELLRAIEAFDALIFSDTKVRTTKADHKK